MKGGVSLDEILTCQTSQSAEKYYQLNQSTAYFRRHYSTVLFGGIIRAFFLVVEEITPQRFGALKKEKMSLTPPNFCGIIDKASMFHTSISGIGSSATIGALKFLPHIAFILDSGIDFAVATAGLIVCYQSVVTVKEMVVEYLTVSLEIQQYYEPYDDIIEWLNQTQPGSSSPQSFSVSFSRRETKEPGKWEEYHEYTPKMMTKNQAYQFEFQGRKLSVQEKPLTEQNDDTRTKLVLRTWGKDVRAFDEFLKTVRKQKEVQEETMTTIHLGRSGNLWDSDNRTAKKKRPLTSVILDDGIQENILEDIKDFMESSKFYREYGIPYHRGYLLYGPPGTGKTSVISAIAGYLNVDICVINLSEKGLTDATLCTLLATAPSPSILLLEDIDAAFGSREQIKASTETTKLEATSMQAFQGMNNLTFSGLLNALDGVAAAENKMVFMTTNHIELLDPALIRPGRVDFKQYIGYASDSQIRRMFLRFFKEADDKEVHWFVQGVRKMHEKSVSVAHLQNLLVRHRKRKEDMFSDNISTNKSDTNSRTAD